jgi:hypothetical protein
VAILSYDGLNHEIHRSEEGTGDTDVAGDESPES